jgi:opacity protein-like surface antigen
MSPIRIFALAALSLAVMPVNPLRAQATPTASRIGDLQVGAGFTMTNSVYLPKLRGGMVYADFDPTWHWGGEFEIHQADTTGNDQSYERTYEIGPRYFRTYGIAVPYAKVMVGRGVLNFPGQYNPVTNTYGASVANLAYNMYALGAGSDFKVRPYLHVRLDYEYQDWIGFPQNGFHPQLFSAGIAYHFNGDLRSRR